MANPPITTAHIPAAMGINEAARPEILNAGEANLRVENLRAFEAGSLTKRTGVQAQTLARIVGAARTSGSRIISLAGGNFGITDTSSLDIYLPGTGKFRNLPNLPNIGYSSVPLQSYFSATAEDASCCNGYICTVSAADDDSSNRAVVVSIVEESSKVEIGPPVVLSSLPNSGNPVLGHPRIAAISSRYFLVAFGTTGTNLTAFYFDTHALTGGWTEIPGGGSSGARLSTTFAASGGQARLAIEQLSDRAVVAYTNNLGGTTRVTVTSFDQTGILQTVNLTTAAANIGAVDIAATSTLWVSWHENDGFNTIRLEGLNPTALTGTPLAFAAAIIAVTLSGSPKRITVIPTGNGTQGTLIVDDNSTPNQVAIRGFTTTAGNAATVGTTRIIRGINTAGRGFYSSITSKIYALAYFGDSANAAEQQQLCLVDLTDTTSLYAPPVVVCSNYLSTTSLDHKGKFFQGSSASIWYFAQNLIKTAQSTTAELGIYNFAARLWESAVYQGCTYLTAGVLCYTDGVSLNEASFLYRAPIPTVALTGTGLTATLGYRYIAVYEHVDSAGNLTRSETSVPSAGTGAFTNKTMTVSVQPLTVTMRRQDSSGGGIAANVNTVRIGLYRTTDGGTTFYRVTTLINDVTSQTITFADTTPDATVAANAQLYTQPDQAGTALDRMAPPALDHITVYNGFLVGSKGTNLYWSGQPVDGEGVWFSPDFQQPVPDLGDITGLAIQDGTLFPFKANAIYATTGESPADNASSGGIGEPRLLAAEVGCANADSISPPTSAGTFFQSKRGIEILTRNSTVEWAGQPVQKTLQTYPTVTAVVLDEMAGLVRFNVSNGTNGTTLIFDVSRLKGWTKDIYLLGNVSGVAPVDASMITLSGNRFAFLLADGTLYTEKDTTSPTAYLDRTADWVTALYEIPTLKLGLLQRAKFHGSMLLINRLSAAGLKVEVAVNNADYTNADSRYLKVFSETDTVTDKLEMRPVTGGEIHALKYRMSDVAPAVLGTGQGLVMIGISQDMAMVTADNTNLPPVAVSGRK